MTLNGHNALCFRLHGSFGVYRENVNEDRLTLSVAMNSNFWYYKDYANIRGDFLERGVKRQWGSWKGRFSVISVAVSPEPLEIMPKLLYANTKTLIAFYWPKSIWPWVTLNDHFTLNCVFVPVCLKLCRMTLELGYSYTCGECRRTLNRNKQLRHRAVSVQ